MGSDRNPSESQSLYKENAEAYTHIFFINLLAMNTLPEPSIIFGRGEGTYIYR